MGERTVFTLYELGLNHFSPNLRDIQVVIDSDMVIEADWKNNRLVVKDNSPKDFHHSLCEYYDISCKQVEDLKKENKKLREELKELECENRFYKSCNNIARKQVEDLKKDNEWLREKSTKFGVPKIKKVIFRDPATIIFWKDGTKTVVKAHNEQYDPEKGLAIAISKKALGNDRGYYETFQRYLPKVKEKKKCRYNRPDVTAPDGCSMCLKNGGFVTPSYCDKCKDVEYTY